jgi:quinol monooxygenase YgiN
MKILSVIRIEPIPEKREEILCIFRSIKGPILAKSGCLDCLISEEDGDEGAILFMEHWQSWEDFTRHIRSEIYSKILEAMELSRQMPNVSFYEVSAIKGMELLRAVRSRNS